jgi:hypothetical protein
MAGRSTRELSRAKNAPLPALTITNHRQTLFSEKEAQSTVHVESPVQIRTADLYRVNLPPFGKITT